MTSTFSVSVSGPIGFGSFVEPLIPRLRNFALKHGCQAADADDVVQQGLARVWISICGDRVKEVNQGFLFGAIRHAFFELLRKNRPLPASDFDLLWEQTVESASPERMAEIHDGAARWFADFPMPEAVRLYRVVGLSPARVATILATSTNAVYLAASQYGRLPTEGHFGGGSETTKITGELDRCGVEETVQLNVLPKSDLRLDPAANLSLFVDTSSHTLPTELTAFIHALDAKGRSHVSQRCRVRISQSDGRRSVLVGEPRFNTEMPTQPTMTKVFLVDESHVDDHGLEFDARAS